MPPSKRRTAHAMAGGSSNTLVGSSPTAADVLVAKCSRAELEKLILTSIRSQEAVALADVEAAIEAAAAALQPKAPVLDDVSMQGAGLLSLICTDVISCIMQDLPLQTKLTFAIEVCKGLRALRQVEALWTRILTVEREHDYYQEVSWINGKGLQRLTAWLPNGGAAVAEVAIHVSKGWSPDHINFVLRRFGHVRNLRLTGQAMVKTMLTDMSTMPRPRLRQLTMDWGTVGVRTVLSVLKQCPNLESLASQKLDITMLEGLAMQMREARGGGTPLLSELREKSLYGALGVFGFCALGSLFPELTKLSIYSLNMQGPNPLLPPMPLCLPNLRNLHVHNLCSSYHPTSYSPHLSSQSLGRLLQLLVQRCPRLESLCLGHGRKYIARSEEMPPFPHLGTALSACPVSLPESLVLLHLSDMLVDPESVAGLSLPRLVFLRLVNCGPDARAAADTLALHCPTLTRDGCCIRAEFETPKLPSDAARLWARHARYPNKDLAGLSLDGVLNVLECGPTANG